MRVVRTGPPRALVVALVLAALTAVLALGQVVLHPEAAGAAPQVVGSSLPAGATLLPGQSLLSPQGRYRLDMQADGNLVLYNPNCVAGAPGCPSPLWALGTWGQPGNHLVMQTDGNLVLYSQTGRPVWDTGSWGTGSANVFKVQDDSNLVVWSGSRPVWASGWVTSYAHVPDRQVGDLASMNGRFRFGTPGNSMHVWDLARTGNPILWGVDCLNDPRVDRSSTNGRLVLQGDGNLVWYQPGISGGWVAEWSTGTAGTGPSNYLVMQDDGNLVLYDLHHRPLWDSMGFTRRR